MAYYGIQHFTLTLTGAAQKLSEVLGNTAVGGADDLAIQFMSLQLDPAATHVAYVGGSNAAAPVTAVNYGFRIEAPAAGIPSAPFVFELAQARIRLSQISVIGTAAEKLHIMVLPY